MATGVVSSAENTGPWNGITGRERDPGNLRETARQGEARCQWVCTAGAGGLPDVLILEDVMNDMRLRRERDRAIREARRAKIALLFTLLVVLAGLMNGTAHNLRRQEQAHRETIIAAAGDDGETLSWMLREQKEREAWSY